MIPKSSNRETEGLKGNPRRSLPTPSAQVVRGVRSVSAATATAALASRDRKGIKLVLEATSPHKVG